ncbi:MAG: hypothetical protein ACKOBW_18080 [Planctomycetota bacterium]
MGQVLETIKTINSLVRTVLIVAGLGVALAASYVVYDVVYSKEILNRQREVELQETQQLLESTQRQLVAREEQIGQLQHDVERQQLEIQRLATSMQLLKVDRRVARLDVVDQIKDRSDDGLITIVDFVELNDRGEPLEGGRRFEIAGDVIYLDYWVVKFDDEYVEQAHIDRSTSLVLFRRLFGEQQQPRDGFVVDQPNRPPRAYTSGSAVSEFEATIWSDFWNIANDERRAADLGIRAAHGQAVSIKTQPGRSYYIQLRASDGLTILPNAPPPRQPRSI